MPDLSLIEDVRPDRERLIHPTDIDIPQCAMGIGAVITSPESRQLLDGVRIQPFALWPDDRGHFLEVQRIGQGLVSAFPPASTQVSATVTYPEIVKAFHYHCEQYDCWTVVKGMMQIALVDLRRRSPTFGERNTIYAGEKRAWQVLIPPGVAHGYKVIGPEAAVLVYMTSRLYDPTDERRVAYDDPRVSYDWDTQFK